MLPDIRYLDKFSTNYVKLFLDKKQRDDGHANAYSNEVVQQLKEFLKSSYYFLVALISIKELFVSRDEWNVNGIFDDCIHEYANWRIESALRTMISSLSRQRHLFRKLKPKLRVNELDRRWRDVLLRAVQLSNERIPTIFRVLSVDFQLTPFAYYLDWLSRNGLTMEQDVQQVLSKYAVSVAYSDDYDAVKTDVKEHIVSIMLAAQKDESIHKKILESAETYAKYCNRLAEQRRREREEQETIKMLNKRADAQEDVWKAASGMDTTFANHYATKTLHTMFERYGETVYVIVGVQVFKKRDEHGDVLYLNNQGHFSRDLSLARKFTTKSDAQEAYKAYDRLDSRWVCEIAAVDLSPYMLNAKRFGARSA